MNTGIDDELWSAVGDPSRRVRTAGAVGGLARGLAPEADLYAGAPHWTPAPAWPEGRPIAQWPRLAAGHDDDLTP